MSATLSDIPKPQREDGDPWSSNMDRAAQERAKGKTYQEIADEIDISKGSVYRYKQRHQNWTKLVDWYRTQMFQKRIENLTQEIWPEALESMKDILQNRKEKKDKDVIQAAKAVLRNTGFKTAQDVRRELEAQKDVTGSAGDQVTIRKERLKEMDEEELEEEIKRAKKTLEEDDLEVVEGGQSEDEDKAETG